MNRENICEFIESHRYDDDEEDSVLIDGQESAFIGYIHAGNGLSATYSYNKIIDNLVNEGCTYEEAVEYFDYNIGRGIMYINEGVKPTIVYPYSP